MNKEPEMDKNFFLAMGLSALVVMGYMHYFQKPQTQPGAAAQAQQGIPVNPKTTAEAAQGLLNAGEKAVGWEAPTAPEFREFRNGIYDAELSNVGGTISRLAFKGEQGKSGLSAVDFFNAKAGEPGLFGVQLQDEKGDLRLSKFEALPQGGERGKFEYRYEKPGEYRLTKQFFFGEDEPILAFEVQIENLGTLPRSFPVVLDYALYAKASGHEELSSESVALTPQKIREGRIAKMRKHPFVLEDKLTWAGLIKKYFALLIKPETPAIRMESRTEENVMQTKLFLEPVMIQPGETKKIPVFIYAGPQRYEVLENYNARFEELLSRGMFGFFKIALLKSLKFLEHYSHNYGWAILILTLFLKLILSPFTHASFESMRKMQAIQPRVKSLQERYKKDPQKLNQEMMELYKKHKVNPLGGCLPMLIQIPIFIAFYQMLDNAIELKGAPFILWIRDLAGPDRFATLPFALPFVGDAINILPLLMVGSMVVQQKMTPQMGSSPEQAKMMAVMMPVMFGLMFYNMPSGLVLYWFLNNVLTIIHQGWVKKIGKAILHDTEEA